MEIGFYQLKTTPLERALPKLLEKVYGSGLRAVIVCPTVETQKLVNSVMWTYAQSAFLPHGMDGEIAGDNPQDHPIWISLVPTNVNQADVLVMANGQEIPPDLAPENTTYKRYIDMFDGNNPAELTAARQRYKNYRAQGHTLTFWSQNEAGGWEKEI